MTQKIEFLNEDEIKEYFEGEDIKILSKIQTSNGILVEYENKSLNLNKEEKELKVRLYTYVNNCKMYYGKKNSTFIQKEAQIFLKNVAKNKLKFMKSNYDWKIENI